MKEHRDARNRGQLKKSAIAEHDWKHDHPIEWNGTQVLDQASRHKELLVKEVLQIRMMKDSSLNEDGGMELHNCWLAAAKISEQRSQYHHMTQRCHKQPQGSKCYVTQVSSTTQKRCQNP